MPVKLNNIVSFATVVLNGNVLFEVVLVEFYVELDVVVFVVILVVVFVVWVSLIVVISGTEAVFVVFTGSGAIVKC